MSERILIATVMRPEGGTGVQTHFRTYAHYLSEQDMGAILVTPYDASSWLVYPIFALRRLLELFSGTASVWWYRHWHAEFLAIALRRFLKDGSSCVVYAQCPLSANAALRERVSAAQRVVMVAHFNISQADEWAEKGDIATEGKLFKCIRKFEAYVLPRLDGLVFVSDFVRREIIRNIPAVENIPFRVVPNFINDNCVEGKFELDGDLVCIGTLEARKNQRYALEIVAASRRCGRPLRLTLVGDGPDRQMLQALSQQLGIEDLVHFAGYVKDAVGLMRRHLAYLHVARMESFGIVLVEAMSRGVPVFAPAVGGIPEVFSDFEEGRFISLDSADATANRIAEWIDSPECMEKSRLAARKKYLENFEMNAVARRLTEFLVKVGGGASTVSLN